MTVHSRTPPWSPSSPRASWSPRLTRDLTACGARGWTITDARGHGPRNRRASELEGGNIRLETLVTDAVAQAIMDVLSREYFPSYAVAAWTSPVTVTRVERYS